MNDIVKHFQYKEMQDKIGNLNIAYKQSISNGKPQDGKLYQWLEQLIWDTEG